MTHTGQIARTRSTQGQTRQDTFQIADLTQHGLQFTGGILQRADSLLTLGEDFVSRTGICSQRLSIRLPIGVTVQSSTEASVFSTPPARFWVISRLRRVAASIMMLSC
jgi:hypothetical protein